MIVENTAENRKIQDVADSMRLSGMTLNENLVTELMKVTRGEKTTEELRAETIRKYAKES